MNCTHNTMTQLPENILPRTEQLVMSDNNLGKLEQVDNQLIQVKTLIFQRSNISFLHEKALKRLLSHVDTLNLKSNKLTKLPQLLQMQTSRTKLWLGDNPYHCNCGMMWMRDWLQNATNVMDKENIVCGVGKWRGELQLLKVNLQSQSEVFSWFLVFPCRNSNFKVEQKTHGLPGLSPVDWASHRIYSCCCGVCGYCCQQKMDSS